jgi:Ni/Fe-hydrogenase subunit HybB-like protein
MPSDIAAAPFIAPGQTYDAIGREIAGIAIGHAWRWRWWIAFAASLGLVGVLMVCMALLFYEGVGLWGNNVPVTWALDIVGYDWWIGVACGGLMVSATLLLLRVEWRSALNRVAETVAVVAAAAAGLYPIIHLGRPWFFYWNLPYPNTLLLWPQFRSPLFWDAIDILSYLVIALGFWYVGMLPDLATLRDRAVERIRHPDGPGTLRAQLYGIAALGWRGSAVHWERWTATYRTLALLGVVLVLSLQTGAAVMFAGSVEPGWHDTLLPVAFVAAALFAGVALVAVAAVLVRVVFALEALVTARHLDVLGWMLLGLGLFNLYCHAAEAFGTALGGDRYEMAVLARRFTGPHASAAWAVILCSLLPVHVFWVPALRRSAWALASVGLLVAFGTFADHFMVIVVTLQHDFLPSSVHPYAADIWGVATFFGTVGLFCALLLLAARTLPIVSIMETRRLVSHGV